MRKLLLSLSVLAGLTAVAPTAFAAAPHAMRVEAAPAVSAVQPVYYGEWRRERARRHDEWRREHRHGGYSGRYYR